MPHTPQTHGESCASWHVSKSMRRAGNPSSAAPRIASSGRPKTPRATAGHSRMHMALAHVPDHGVAELGALDPRGAHHQAMKIVGDGAGGDGASYAAQDLVGGLRPAKTTEHHLAPQNDGAGGGHLFVGVLRRRALPRLPARVP